MWFGRDFVFSIPCQPVPIPSSLLLNRDHLEMLRFAWSNSIFASNSVQSQILHFRGWSKVGTHPGGIWSCCAPNWEIREGKIRRKKGRILRESQFLWSVLKAGAVWAAVSPQPAQRCLLTSFRTCLWGFLLELFSLEAGNSCCRMCENPGELMVGECRWERSRIWKIVAKGRNSPFWISVGSKGEPLHPKICHHGQGGFLKHFLH